MVSRSRDRRGPDRRGPSRTAPGQLAPGQLATAILATLVLSALTPVATIRAQSRAEADATQEVAVDSRAEQLLALRRARLAAVTPAPRSRWVDFLTTMENKGFDSLITWQHDRFRYGFGEISRASRFSPAVLYERPRIGQSELSARASAAYSIHGYQVYDILFGKFDAPAPYEFFGTGFLGAPFEFDTRSQTSNQTYVYGNVRYQNFPRERYYGSGVAPELTDFRLEEGAAEIVAGYQPVRWLGVRAQVGWLTSQLGRGNDDAHADTVVRFANSALAGLDHQPDTMRYETAVYLGYAGDPNRPSGLIGLLAARYDDVDGDAYDFARLSVDARGQLPLGSRQRVLAARGYASHDDPTVGSDVPFYRLASLGGSEGLRGYPDFRFRDRNLLYLTVEYRWEANPGIELAAFYDTGKAFRDSGDFSLSNLQDSYGVGIRFKSRRRVTFRLDVGQSRAGTLVHFRFGPSF